MRQINVKPVSQPTIMGTFFKRGKRATYVYKRKEVAISEKVHLDK